MSKLSFARGLSRKPMAGVAAGMLVVGALFVGPVLAAPAVQAAPDQPVSVETATAVVTPPVPTEPETVPESTNDPLSTTAETPDGTDAGAVPVAPVDVPVEAPAGTVAVTSDAETVLVLGQKIAYTFTVTNTGNVALSGLALKETRGVGTACDTTTVAVGAAATCTSSHVVTQGDMDNYLVQNVVYGTAVTPVGTVVELAAGSVTDYGPRPLAAATLSFVSDAPGNADVVHGQKITYTITMTNTGDVTLQLLQHFYQTLSADTTCRGQILSVGGTLTCTSIHWVTDVDVKAGSISNTIAISLVGPAGTGASLGPATLTNRVVAGPIAEVVPVVAPVVQGNLAAGDALANTGSAGTAPMLLGAGALMLLGASTLTLRRRQKRAKA